MPPRHGALFAHADDLLPGAHAKDVPEGGGCIEQLADASGEVRRDQRLGQEEIITSDYDG